MQKDIAQIITEKFKVVENPLITRPNKNFGDYSTNVSLILAKKTGRTPLQVAETIAKELQLNPNYRDVSIAGPGFINWTVTPKFLVKALNHEWSENFGGENVGAGKTVIVEFPSNNMAKPYSIGHLRPGNQGWAAKKLHQKMGWKVITDNHLGDYGTPFGIWVVGFLNFSSESALQEKGVYELGRLYIKTKQALTKEEEQGGNVLAKQVQAWLLKLENGDEAAQRYNERFRKISLDHIHDIMSRLRIKTDYEFGEAYYAPLGKKVVQQLVKDGRAQKNADNSIIIDINDYGIKTPVLVQKANGAALYATTDIATIIHREEQFNPTKVVYAVGDEQSFYFKQLFAVARKLGVDTELVHLNFGLIDQINEQGMREKMSSRKGVVLMEELLDKAEKKAYEIAEKGVQEGNVRPSIEDIKKVALGAIKFSDFMADRRTNILFDWESIFSLNGFSGPAVQYAAVRINNIINKETGGAQVDDNLTKLNLDEYDFSEEKDVLLKLLDYPEVVRLAYEKLEPHRLAAYLYELSRTMNRYYDQVRIKESKQPIKEQRLNLLKKVSFVLSDGLDILGIEVPQRM